MSGREVESADETPEVARLFFLRSEFTERSVNCGFLL